MPSGSGRKVGEDEVVAVMKDWSSAPIMAGVAKVDITNTHTEHTDDPLYANIDAGTINDRLYVKALVLKQGETVVVLITVDAVAIAEIGTISEGYLRHVREELKAGLGIDPDSVLINASHCHGIVCSDIAERTVQAVTKAWKTMVAVNVGMGCGYEDRIMENRRLRLKNGREADVRRAYSLVDRKSTRLNSSHSQQSRIPSSA